MNCQNFFFHFGMVVFFGDVGRVTAAASASLTLLLDGSERVSKLNLTMTHATLDIQIDIANPNNILISTARELLATDLCTTTLMFNLSVWDEDVSSWCPPLKGINSFQQLSSEEILLALYCHRCILKLNRSSGQTEWFAGQCEVSGSTLGHRLTVQFGYLTSLYLLPDGITLLMTDRAYDTLLALDLSTSLVSLTVPVSPLINKPLAIYPDPFDSGSVFITTHSCIVSVKLASQTVTKIAGDCSDTRGGDDGPFGNALFDFPTSIIAVGNDLLVGDRNGLRFLQSSSQMVATACLASGTDEAQGYLSLYSNSGCLVPVGVTAFFPWHDKLLVGTEKNVLVAVDIASISNYSVPTSCYNTPAETTTTPATTTTTSADTTTIPAATTTTPAEVTTSAATTTTPAEVTTTPDTTTTTSVGISTPVVTVVSISADTTFLPAAATTAGNVIITTTRYEATTRSNFTADSLGVTHCTMQGVQFMRSDCSHQSGSKVALGLYHLPLCAISCSRNATCEGVQYYNKQCYILSGFGQGGNLPLITSHCYIKED